MTRMTKRLEDGQAAMDCVFCARQGVVCHLLSCRNRLKNRLCDYEDVMQSNKLVEQKHGRWLYDSGSGKHFCSACDECALSFKKDTLYGGELYEVCLTDYCPNCGAKMDGDGNG